ncbi:unnamed protein product [Clonostachys rhizophaga]|uniref:F-box domain-containing protein n=1 Tax=Clonostachys rhizophaga TaxID=160324 RepID=A0A9N9VA89_9HYPO|nr:unnamed protein product [Clonostachys rhizophaga]
MSRPIQLFNAAMATGGFASLPTEVFFTILENDCLSLEDIASLRLTCRSFSESRTDLHLRTSAALLILPNTFGRSNGRNSLGFPVLSTVLSGPVPKHEAPPHWNYKACFTKP